MDQLSKYAVASKCFTYNILNGYQKLYTKLYVFVPKIYLRADYNPQNGIFD